MLVIRRERGGRVECHNLALGYDIFCQRRRENSRLYPGSPSEFLNACKFNTLAYHPASSQLPVMEAELPY
jgi:hypothetical protein